jgi:excinuclease ABC subunit A
VIDLGPEGGEIVAEGTPEDGAGEPRSYTGQYLKDILARSERVESAPAMKLGRARAKAAAMVN